MQKILQRPEMRVVAVALAGALAFGMLLAQPIAARADTSVSAVDDSFSPQTITIAPGDTVTWTNNGTMQHTVTADNGSYDSGALNPGATFSHTFTTAGTFPYHCTFHGAAGGVGMSGTVVVDASLASSASSTGSSTSTSSGTTTSATSTATTTTASAPLISNVIATSANTGATITWTTDVNSDSQVAYGTTTTYTTTTPSDGMAETSHSVDIAGLTPNTTYHFQAISNASGMMGMSSDGTFTTTNTGSTSTSTMPMSMGSSSTSTPSSNQDAITQLENEITALEAQLQALLGAGTPFPPNTGGGGSDMTPMSSTLGTAVFADNYTVAPGGTVHFNGKGFGANENVTIKADGSVVGSAQSDQNGEFTVSGSAATATGDTTYWFTGQNSGKRDSVIITVEDDSSGTNNE